MSKRLGYLRNVGFMPEQRAFRFRSGQRPGNLAGFGDLDPSELIPLRNYMAQWQTFISTGAKDQAIAILSAGGSLAETLMSKSGVAPQTSSILGSIASNIPLVVQAISSQGTNAVYSEPTKTTYANINGNINLLIKGDNTSGAITYLTVVDQQTSTGNLLKIQNQLAALQRDIGVLQPGGAWNPAESLLATSAEKVSPLQDRFVGILAQISSTPLTDFDREVAKASAKLVGDFLGNKVVKASTAGEKFSKILDVAGAVLGIESGSGSEIKAKNELNLCLEHPEQCQNLIPQPLAFILAHWKALAIGSGLIVSIAAFYVAKNASKNLIKTITFGLI